jgi:hypothetical protein
LIRDRLAASQAGPSSARQGWRVPARVQVTDAEVDVFEAWFDELFGPYDG